MHTPSNSAVHAARIAVLLSLAVCLSACSAPRGRSWPGPRAQTVSRLRSAPDGAVAIRRIACLYDRRPWLNLDRAGDLDPEGIWFRAYLDPGTGRGVPAEGMFHIEMYVISRVPGAGTERVLASDWHYPSSEMTRIGRPGMLGDGYVLQLRWADKDVAGKEIEMVVRFEDELGNVARSGTKRLRVPSYGY